MRGSLFAGNKLLQVLKTTTTRTRTTTTKKSIATTFGRTFLPTNNRSKMTRTSMQAFTSVSRTNRMMKSTMARLMGQRLGLVTRSRNGNQKSSGLHSSRPWLSSRVLGTSSRVFSSSSFQSGSGGMGMGMGMQQGSGRVEEVEWQAENVNSVTLIGRLGSEPEIKYLEDGKVIASASIAVNKGKNVAPSWFELSFWNETARAVSETLRKGQQIQVTGRLVQSTWQDRQTGMKREKIRVTVRDVALITGDVPANQTGGYGGASGGAGAGGGGGGYRQASSSYGGGAKRGGGSVQSKDIEAQWAALFCSPDDFWDNRASKKNSRAPDFKHKETGEALWVESRNTPSWVASSLKELDLNKQVDINALLGSDGQRNNEEIPF